MKLLKPFTIIETPIIDPKYRSFVLQTIERAARTCYKSEGKATEDSAPEFVKKMVRVRKHESVLEHASVTVRFVVDRGVSHELVRHRLAAFSQESTRYVDYSGEKAGGHCQFIIPPWCTEIPEGQCQWYNETNQLRDLDSNVVTVIQAGGSINWLSAMQAAENSYKSLGSCGWTPEKARSVLPNSTKTEVVMTCNMREWRHVFKLRALGTTGRPHPQMVEVMAPLLKEFQKYLPEIFGDLEQPNLL